MRNVINSIKEVVTAKITDFGNIDGFVKLNVPKGNLFYKDNGANILAVAHLDFIKDNSFSYVKLVNNDYVMYSHALDDRLGAWIILNGIPLLAKDIKYDILLTDLEESCHSTAQYFEKNKSYNWMFEFDRHGTGCVMYQYDTLESVNMVKGIFTVENGSYSDIAALEHLGCLGFNFGTGYEQEHTPYCNANLQTVMHQINKFALFYEKNKDKKTTFTRDYKVVHCGNCRTFDCTRCPIEKSSYTCDLCGSYIKISEFEEYEISGLCHKCMDREEISTWEEITCKKCDSLPVSSDEYFLMQETGYCNKHQRRKKR